IRQMPKSMNLIYLLGMLDRQAGHYESAAECFRVVLDNRPHHLPGYLELADVYSKVGRGNDACRVLLRAIKIAPERPGLYIRLAEQLEMKKDYSGAALVLRKGADNAGHDTCLDTYAGILKVQSQRMSNYENAKAVG
ncbi:MAG: tetratricopeptide repeat protein, partial [Candidatus Zixiibacteriota bacterium]